MAGLESMENERIVQFQSLQQFNPLKTVKAPNTYMQSFESSNK